MSLTDPFLLPADVVLTSVAQLPPELAGKFGHEAGDVAVTRPRARTPSSIVDAETAALLAYFRRPMLIVDAVMRRSLEVRSDPHVMLESVYPVLEQLITSRLLVPAHSVEAAEITASLQPGEQILGYTVVRSVQVVEDTELFLGRSRAAQFVALKLLRAGSHEKVRRMAGHEATILRRLDGRVNPRLLDVLAFREQPCLVMEWRPGVNAAAAAAELREDQVDDGGNGLLSLCCTILRAYAHLHAQRVIHSDIHPRNILIAGDGGVNVIDYGLSYVGNEPDLDELGMYRGGVGFFFEPEYAEAILAQRPPPQPSFLGEQYALAALLYSLFTGMHYVDFSLERSEMMKQILYEPPVPFSDRGVTPWSAVERVIERALRKHPEERFASVAEFAECLRRATPRAAQHVHASNWNAAPTCAADALLAEFLDRVRLSGSLASSGLTTAPTASVNYGAAGLALALYRIALAREDASLLATADVWASRAAAEASSETAFANPSLDITARTVGRISPYHTVSGVYAVRALIAHSLGDTASQQEAILAFCMASRELCESIDLALGRSGTLLASALLLETAPGSEVLQDLGNSTMQGIWDEIGTLPPIPECLDLPHLGIAHGWAGVLYATFCWCRSAGSPLPPLVGERLAELASLAQPFGRGARWPVLVPAANPGGAEAFAPGWCNGSAGYVHLWTLAHQLLSNDDFLVLASQAGWHAWEESRSVGQLCCGLAGQAYALVNLYRHTGERSWLNRAIRLARTAPSAPGIEDFPCSLYKGKVGIAVLIAELDTPEDARMPFFENEGWRTVDRGGSPPPPDARDGAPGQGPMVSAPGGSAGSVPRLRHGRTGSAG